MVLSKFIEIDGVMINVNKIAWMRTVSFAQNVHCILIKDRLCEDVEPIKLDFETKEDMERALNKIKLFLQGDLL